MGISLSGWWRRGAGVTALVVAAVFVGVAPAAANVAPIAFDTSETTRHDVPLDIFLDASDDDFDDLTYAVVSGPSHGILSDCSGGDCTYTPNGGYTGPDAFTWKANDGLADSNVATFSISVVTNSVPVATNQSVPADAGASNQIFLDAFDDDGDPLTVTIVTPPAHGVITGGTCPDVVCEYTPTAGYLGSDSFVYHVSDGTATSNNATVSIAVQGSTKILSAGPLTKIGVNSELNCSVNHTGDSAGEFYGDTACATFLAVGPVGGSVLYGPSSVPAGISGEQVWTAISQTPVTGAGTAANPFTIVSVVDAGATGLRVTQTDTYVVGQEAYRTDVRVDQQRRCREARHHLPRRGLLSAGL